MLAKLLNGDPLGKIALGFWIISLLSNNSESSYFMQVPLWFALLLVAIDYGEPVAAATTARFSRHPDPTADHA